MKARIFIMTAFAALMIGAVTVSAEDTPEVTEPFVTTAETTTTETTVTAVSETTTATTAPPNTLLGDANGDGVMNVRDCALIARKLAEDKADELSPETADYNKDSIINVRDAALIAHDLDLHFTQSNKTANAENNLNSISDIKRYVNDTVIRRAYEQYGITDIMADDNVKSNTWYAPTILLTDIEYYSRVTSVEKYGVEDIMPNEYVVNANAAIADLMNAFECIAKRTNPDGSAVDISKKRIRIKWTQIGDSNNFEIYVCYGGDY